MLNVSTELPLHMRANIMLPQKGVGMVEVLVALFVLAIAVLGFGGLQVGAMQLTQESGQRTEAQRIASELGNRVLAKTMVYVGRPDSLASMNAMATTYQQSINGITTKVSVGDLNKCVNKAAPCTLAAAIQDDARDIVYQAQQQGMRIALVDCPTVGAGGMVLQCAIVAWGETNPTIGNGKYDCITSQDVYSPTSTCYRSEGL